MTDLMPHVVDNLRHNVRENTTAKGDGGAKDDAGSRAVVCTLDWCDLTGWPAGSEGSYDVVIGSGLIYQAGITPTLVGVISKLLKPGTGTFLHVSAKNRDGLPQFRKGMVRAVLYELVVAACFNNALW
jgi:hypothetical protein